MKPSDWPPWTLAGQGVAGQRMPPGVLLSADGLLAELTDVRRDLD